jgi:hypothetical protein
VDVRIFVLLRTLSSNSEEALSDTAPVNTIKMQLKLEKYVFHVLLKIYPLVIRPHLNSIEKKLIIREGSINPLQMQHSYNHNFDFFVLRRMSAFSFNVKRLKYQHKFEVDSFLIYR